VNDVMNTGAAVSSPIALSSPIPGQSALYRCRIRHQRTAPLQHGFGYRTHLWLVDLDDPPRLPAVLRPLARFRSADHLGPGARRRRERAGPDGGPAAIKAELVRWCAQQGADVSDCRILMLTAARSLGYVFNPLTVYWCLDPDGTARRVIAEVHNTYGARHCYLLEPQDGPYEAEKLFYVSPFFGIEGGYRMTMPVPGSRLHVAVTLTLPDGSTPFVATVRGTRRPASADQLLRALVRDPFAGYRVPVAIRFQAIRLLLRGLPIRPGHRGPVPDSAAPAVPAAAIPALASTRSPESAVCPVSRSVTATGGARHGRHK